MLETCWWLEEGFGVLGDGLDGDCVVGEAAVVVDELEVDGGVVCALLGWGDGVVEADAVGA